MEVDKLKDFNGVIKSYKGILELAKKVKPNLNNLKSVYRSLVENNWLLGASSIEPVIMLTNNISLYISQIHEKTKDVDKRLIEDEFEKMDFLGNIESKQGEMSLKEKKIQIRNSLAHADYNIELECVDIDELSNNTGTTTKYAKYNPVIVIDNDKIKAKISIEDLDKIAMIYREIFVKYVNGDNLEILVTRKNTNIRNVSDYLNNTKLFRINRRRDDKGVSFTKIKYWLNKYVCPSGEEKENEQFDQIKEDYKSFEIEEKEIGSNIKAFLESYSKYIGQSNLTNFYVGLALNQMIPSFNEGILSIELLRNVIETFKNLKMYNDVLRVNEQYQYAPEMLETIERSVDELNFYSLQGSMIYTNNLIALAYYELNYAREINDKSNGTYFNYYNIKNLDGITATITDKNGNKESVPIEEIYLEKLNNRMDNINGEISNLNSLKENKENLQESLNNPQNKNPKKEIILKEIEEWMENEYNPRIQKLKKEEEELSEKIKNEDGKGTRSSFEFFRHLRNSLAHGNYQIIYEDLNNLENTKFIFNDEDKNKGITYSVELTAGQLEKILDGFQQKVNECDKGYLESKSIEKRVIESGIFQMGIGKTEVDSQVRPREHAFQNGIRRIPNNNKKEEL